VAEPIQVAEPPGAANATVPPLFEDLLSQLGRAHAQDLEGLQKKCDAEHHEAERLRGEVDELRRSGLSSTSPCSADGGTSLLERLPRNSKSFARSITPMGLKSEDIVVEDSVFHVLPGWEKALGSDAGYDTKKTMRLFDEIARGGSRRIVEGIEKKGCLSQPYVIMPTSTFRLLWDIAGLFLICYDMLAIPFDQSFQPEPSTFTDVMDWFTLIFWSFDMIQGFFLGYYADGHVVTDNWQIVRNYLKTWFMVDVIVVFPEWGAKFLPVSDDAAEAGGLGKFAKIARIARILRMLRLLKMKKLMETLMDRIESEYSFILFNLIHMLSFVLVLNHVIACVWYLIGRLTRSAGLTNWIDSYQDPDEDIAFQYATSLHWSLTQFTPASMDISARNLVERIFSVMVLMFAMMVFSSVVANITASMTALRNLEGDHKRQFWRLRRYLRQRNIHKSLSSRILKFLEHRSAIQGKLVQRDKIPILSALSEPLQSELSYEMHSHSLGDHPFFEELKRAMPVVMHQLCRLALGLMVEAMEDFAFNAGDEAKKMYFVKSGELDYVTLIGEKTTTIRQKDWLVEHVLFTPWRHKGCLQAATESELVSVDPKQFMMVMSVHPRPWQFAVSYAREFVGFLNALPTQEDLTDICRYDGMYQKLMEACEGGQLSHSTPSLIVAEAAAGMLSEGGSHKLA